jgi:hypothetical protein
MAFGRAARRQGEKAIPTSPARPEPQFAADGSTNRLAGPTFLFDTRRRILVEDSMFCAN